MTALFVRCRLWFLLRDALLLVFIRAAGTLRDPRWIPSLSDWLLFASISRGDWLQLGFIRGVIDCCWHNSCQRATSGGWQMTKLTWNYLGSVQTHPCIPTSFLPPFSLLRSITAQQIIQTHLQQSGLWVGMCIWARGSLWTLVVLQYSVKSCANAVQDPNVPVTMKPPGWLRTYEWNMGLKPKWGRGHCCNLHFITGAH